MKYSIKVAASKHATFAKNIYLADELENTYCLGVFANSGDIKFKPAWGTGVGQPVATALATLKAKLVPGFSGTLEVKRTSNGLNWKLEGAAAQATDSSVTDVIENADEEFSN